MYLRKKLKVNTEVKALSESFSFDVNDVMIKKLIRGFNGNCEFDFDVYIKII